MRHKIAYRKLNRTSEHRKAMIKNMLNSLIKHEQIETTLPKAKELKIAIDKVITIGKKNNLASKKILFSKLQDSKSVKKLTDTLSKRYENRKGGYSRVLKYGFRFGDNSPKAIIELVERDVNVKGLDDKLREKNKNTESENSISENKSSSVEASKAPDKDLNKNKVKEKDDSIDQKSIKKDK